jgi:hypothetical protein
MKQFNYRLFFIITLILSIVTYFSFTEAFSRDAGTLGPEPIHNFVADLYNIMRFPTHVVLARFMQTPFMFAIGLIINCVIYSILIERIIYFIISLFQHKDTSAE